MPDHSLPFVLTAVAALGSAIVGGIFYGFSSFVMAALQRLPAQHGADAMKTINLTVITPSFMLVFMGMVLLSLLLAVGSFVWWDGPAGGLLLAASAAYLVGCFGVTMAFNVPLNNRLAALTGAPAAGYWPQYVGPWLRWNHVRTAASLLSSGLFVAALLLRL